MNLLLYLFLTLIIILFLNKLLVNNNLLISLTGDKHQKFTSKSKIPLTGGILLFLHFLYFLDQNILSFLLFSFLILNLGIFSDLKFLKSAKLRLISQISVVLFFIIFNNVQINNTRIEYLDKILELNIINYLFVCFCVLIVINGSNFIDGLNTLNLGYYFLIGLIILYLNLNQLITLNNMPIEYFLIFLFSVLILNLLNKVYLGDSGSYLVGFSFSVFLINIYNWNNHISPFFIVLLLWYPCYETLFSIIRKNILRKSPLSPDSNHFHQLIYFFIKKTYKQSTLGANLMSAQIINVYNLIIFLIAMNFVSNSTIQVSFIIFNVLIYTIIYFKTFVYKYKNLK
jgi:UDP-N-acetylmuramyl pentapeptide phosphotransferase/UDP-N-acetylglucosamine-1-phosphate transferase